MNQKYQPINEKVNCILHGADYNPEQWIKTPEIWDEDIRLMKLSKCNVMSVGIFSWTMLEPEDGVYDFGWLDTIMDKLAAAGMYAVLATPTAAKPAWMAQKYPEILRVERNRVRNLQGHRHNHCYTSPVYRQKAAAINRLLAERYKDHPALIMWHISNEFGGECHCPLCQEAFRSWLKTRYDNDLEKLNDAYWTNFWSHKFTDWSQIESPSDHGESLIHALNLDWKRFVTYQTIDFFKNEITPLRELTPNIGVTANFMGTYKGLDYWKFAKECDVVSWDCYPRWHTDSMSLWEMASATSFTHDINRSLKGGKPFMLMESTPSNTNWMFASKLKRPGVHLLSSMQAVAHGSDTVQYFQWRKSRGSCEKFHGAVVDHVGNEHTRIFNDVTEVGDYLAKLTDIIGTSVQPEVAIVYDWENCWAIDDLKGLHTEKREYTETCIKHYNTFWKNGIPVDVIDMDCDFSKYKVLITPMLYMVKPTVGERIESFVKNGGTYIATYWSGIVDENDLCFLGGFPGPLRNVLGIWSEEIDTLYNSDKNSIVMNDNNKLNIKGSYGVFTFCDLIHAETAETLATYGSDFYSGMPALTVNKFGEGEAYYIAARTDNDFLDAFYNKIIASSKLKKVINTKLPLGVTAQMRTDGQNDFVFLMNFTESEQNIVLDDNNYTDMYNDSTVNGSITMKAYGLRILKRTHK